MQSTRPLAVPSVVENSIKTRSPAEIEPSKTPITSSTLPAPSLTEYSVSSNPIVTGERGREGGREEGRKGEREKTIYNLRRKS